MIPNQFWLTDAQFSRIGPHLPTDTLGKTRVDDHRIISGIVHVLKSGGRWIDAPPEYGPKKTLYNRYVAGLPMASGSICSKLCTATRDTTATPFVVSRGPRRYAEHSAQGRSVMDELLLAFPLSKSQRHRAHVLPLEGLQTRGEPPRPERQELPRRRMHRRNCQLLVMSLDPNTTLADFSGGRTFGIPKRGFA
jgi:transposase